MLSNALHSPADLDNYINKAFFNLMKSAAEIHQNQHDLTADCIYQIKIAVNVLGNIIKRNQESFGIYQVTEL